MSAKLKEDFNAHQSALAKKYEHYLTLAQSEIERSNAHYALGYVHQCVADMKALNIDAELLLQSGETEGAKELLQYTRTRGNRPYTYASGNLRLGHALYPIAFTSGPGPILFILSKADASGQRWPQQFDAITLESFSTMALQLAATEEALKSYAPGGKNSWDSKKLIALKK